MDMMGKVRRMKLRGELFNSAVAKLTALPSNTARKWLKTPGDTAFKQSWKIAGRQTHRL